jgi:hypothetical protein
MQRTSRCSRLGRGRRGSSSRRRSPRSSNRGADGVPRPVVSFPIGRRSSSCGRRCVCDRALTPMIMIAQAWQRELLRGEPARFEGLRSDLTTALLTRLRTA